MLLDDWRERGGKAHLVRYEDLIARPQETLADLFSYLEVDASPTTVEMVLDRALAESSCEQRQHRTSSTVARLDRPVAARDGAGHGGRLRGESRRAARGLRIRKSVGSRPRLC